MSVCYHLTINNWTRSDEAAFEALATTTIYTVYGKEIARTGTPHLQCFIMFTNDKSFLSVRKLFPRAHIEKMKTTISRSIEYCKKECDYVESGSMALALIQNLDS